MPGIVAVEPFLEVIGVTLAVAAITDGLELGIGQGRPPLPVDGAAEPRIPYLIIYSIQWDTLYDSPPMSSDQDVPLAFQTTSVGATAQQARAVDDWVRRKLTALSPSTGTWVTAVVVPGLNIMGRRCVSAGGEDSDVRLTSVPSRFVFDVSAAGA